MPSAVIGSGPIGFTDKEGNQQFIPLSQLYFDDYGKVTVKGGQLGENNEVVDALLKNLVAGGFLKSAPTLPPKPAIVIKAAIPGAKGNTIQVTFSNFRNIPTGKPPVNITTFDAEIIAKATYSNLSSDPISTSFIGKVLGVGATPGISPGLVRVKQPAPNTQIQQPKAIKTSTKLGQSNPSVERNFFVVQQEGTASDPAFTLEAWKGGADGQNIEIAIPDVNPGDKTFTLVVEWTQPKIVEIALTELPSKLAGLGFVITVSPPEGESFGIPAPGTIVLSGGADAQDAVPAEKVVFSR
jgi:hypothetical protein